MIKKISCFVLSIVLIFAWCLNVNAASATADLTPTSKTVKAGDTFTVTLYINCVDGINGATGITYSYETSILELISSEVKDTNFMNIGNTTTIDLISNSSSKITESNIYEFTFKVKEDATPGATAKITINSFSVDSDAQTNSETTIETKFTTITVASNESSEPQNVDKETGIKPETEKEKGEQTPAPNAEDKQNETPVGSEEKPKTAEIKTSEETTKQTEKSTLSNKILPKTGIARGVVLLILVTTVITFVSFIKYKSMNQ